MPKLGHAGRRGARRGVIDIRERRQQMGEYLRIVGRTLSSSVSKPYLEPSFEGLCGFLHEPFGGQYWASAGRGTPGCQSVSGFNVGIVI